MSDLYDALQRQHEERTRAARDMAGMLGLAKLDEADTPVGAGGGEKPRDGQGRFVGTPVGTADAGEHSAPVMPRPSMGHMIMAHIEDDPSYLDG